MNTSLPYPTLIDALWRNHRTRGIARDAVLVLGFSMLTVACARIGFALPSPIGRAYIGVLGHLGIVLPNTPVPVSGQTFAVLLSGLLLGSKRGALAILTYLAYGFMGFGVFALGANAWSPSAIPGVPVMLGPTAGHLYGFPVAAFVVGLLAERGWDRHMPTTLLTMALGSLLVYAFGLSWLARYAGLDTVLPLGFYPFVPGDMVKAMTAATLLPGAWRGLRLLGVMRDAQLYPPR